MAPPFNFYKYMVLRPEVFQAQLMQQFVQGKFLTRDENISPFIRAQVISFDNEGGNLENPGAEGSCRSRSPDSMNYYDIQARVGPKNPPRSLRARIVSNHYEANAHDQNLRVYWPLFPATGVDPVPLEFVYVFFDSNDRRHGVWVSRVSGPEGERTNFAAGDDPIKDAAKSGSDGKESKAVAFGDQPQPEKDYTTQEAIVGTDPDESSKTGMEYA